MRNAVLAVIGSLSMLWSCMSLADDIPGAALFIEARSMEADPARTCLGTLVHPRLVLTSADCVGEIRAEGTWHAHVLSLEGSGPAIVGYVRGTDDQSGLVLLKLESASDLPPVRLVDEATIGQLVSGVSASVATAFTDAPAKTRNFGLGTSAPKPAPVSAPTAKSARAVTGVETTLVGQIYCQASGQKPDRQICARTKSARAVRCAVPDGAALLARRNDGAPLLLGAGGRIANRLECDAPGALLVFTRASTFTGWITRTARDEDLQPPAVLADLGEDEAKAGSLLVPDGILPDDPKPTPRPRPSADTTPPDASGGMPDSKPRPTDQNAASSVQPVPDQGTQFPMVAPGDRALLIGVDQYQMTSLDFDVPASGTDVDNMKHFLISHYGFREEQILTLTDHQATRANVLRAFDDWLVAGSVPGARVWLYFSGHGYFQTDLNHDEADGMDEVLIMHDTELVDDSTAPITLRNHITDDEIGAMFSRIDDRQAWAIVDSCHSGTTTRALGAHRNQRLTRSFAARARTAGYRNFGMTQPTPDAPPSPQPEPSPVIHNDQTGYTEVDSPVVSWSAVSPRQVALVDIVNDPAQGVFTRLFIRGVLDREADADRDGEVLNSELLAYLRDRSEAFCRDMPGGCPTPLTPMLEGPPDTLRRTVSGKLISSSVGEAVEDSLPPPDLDNGLRIGMEPSKQVSVGDSVTFHISSRQGGEVLIFNLDPAGDLIQLFPNAISDRNNRARRINANGSISIPDASYGFSFNARPPAGKGYVFAIVSRDPLGLEDVIDRQTDFNSIDNPARLIDRIARKMAEPYIDAYGTRQRQAEFGFMTYEIH